MNVLFGLFTFVTNMWSKRFIIYFCLVLAMIFWGFSFVGTKISLDGNIQPITLVLIRLIISGFFMLILTKSLGILQNIKKKDVKWFLLIAFFEPLCYFLCETFGLQLVTSTLGSVIISTIPLFVPWAAWLIYREKVSLLNLLGIIISIVGVLLIIFERNLTFNVSISGVFLLFIAVFSAVGYTMVLRHIIKTYSPVTIITWQNIIGIFVFLPLFFVCDMNLFSFSLFTPKIIFTILCLGIFPSSLSYVFYSYAVRELGVNKSSIFTNLIPAITAIFAYCIMNEELPLSKVIGILIVIFALFISQINKIRW